MCVQRRITISKLFGGHHRFVVKRCKKASFPQHPRSNFTSSSQNIKRNQRLVMITHSDWTVRNRFALNGSGPSSIALRRLVTFRFALVPLFLFLFFKPSDAQPRQDNSKNSVRNRKPELWQSHFFLHISVHLLPKEKKPLQCTFAIKTGFSPNSPNSPKLFGNLPSEMIVLGGILNPYFHYDVLWQISNNVSQNISNSWGTNSLNMKVVTTPTSTPHSNRV